MRRQIFLLAAVGVFMVTLLMPQDALAPPLYQPDVLVTNNVGRGVHDPTGAGEIKPVTIHRYQKKTLLFWNFNDGGNTDTFSYWGCTGTSDFMVTWRNSLTNTDVTQQVISGTYTTPPLDPGWSETLPDLHVKARFSAAPGNHLTCRVLATSAGDGTQDAAGYRIRVVA